MHMRNKKWAKPELNACDFYTDTPQTLIGKWHEQFADPSAPLFMELGCGKGVSTAKMVSANPSVNYVVIDIAPNVLGDTRRNIVKAYEDQPVKNVIIAKTNIEYIHECFSAEDRIKRIYINFCNPWTKRGKHEKRRLTHPRQLFQYRSFMDDDAEIWFKTDDDLLFEDSLVYFEKCGFAVQYISRDLHADGFEPNYESEHEKKFSDEGVPIKFVIVRKMPGDWEFDATRWRRDLPQTESEEHES